ncbi:MAG: RtcB family protein [Rhodocyclaceae bacterium]
MDASRLERISDFAWRLPRSGRMRVPGILYADAALMREMDDKVLEQIANVAALPGIVEAAYAMPDAHWGYGFPIGGVAAFDAAEGGVVSAGGVGFDISCGVRTLLTGLTRSRIEPLRHRLAEALFAAIPAGLGSTGALSVGGAEMDALLREGAHWAVARGWGEPADLERIEEGGRMAGADPAMVSEQAKRRQRDEVGTLGSGNHYLEVQEVEAISDEAAARAFGLAPGDIVLSIHCGSRGLGHQIGTDYLKRMVSSAASFGIGLPDRELACAPIDSALGRAYLGAMRAAINCAFANRQVLTHLARGVFARLFPGAALTLLYDVSHNTCKVETHEVAGAARTLHVHRKGATRAFGPGHPELPAGLREAGQPVLIGGSMGTASWILAGSASGERASFSSACHGAGRRMSRHQATRTWSGREIIARLDAQGVLIRSPSLRGVAEEAPDAYKDVSAVVEASERAGLARRVARLRPLVCIKG